MRIWKETVLSTTVLLWTLSLGAGVAFAAEADGKKRKQIPDDRIREVIESELIAARGVDANPIDVSVKQGIVALKGSVDNILSHDRAIRLAEVTKGVVGIVDQIEVKPMENRPDSDTKRDVNRALLDDPATDSWQVKADVENGQVTLRGTVDSWSEAQLAETVAKSVRGVTGVTNLLGVNFQALRPDSEIREEIQQRIAWDIRLDDELIIVKVEDGTVTLSGRVGSMYEKSLASNFAHVQGVEKVVDDQLTVSWWSRDRMHRKSAWTPRTDDEIQDAVEAAFLYDPRVFAFNPDVKVEGGVVTLSGTVDNLKAKKAAAQDAKNTVGVMRVENHLKVRPFSVLSNEEIEQDVRSALRRDPFVGRIDVTVSAWNGNVTLSGQVDSYYEKEQAEDVAARVNGVTEVHNYLTVNYDYPGFSYYDYYDWDPTLYNFSYDYETTRVKPDTEIKQQIESQLWWSPWVDSDQVSVEVADGKATLTGTVDSWHERSKATENAIEGGAVKVKNQLQVSS